MPNTYLSVPVFLSGTSDIIGYVCPANKTAIIKAINLANETSDSGVLSILWKDNNNVGIGSTMNTYPVYISGIIPRYSVAPGISEFLVIQESDQVIFRTTTTGRLAAILSIMEQEPI
jgi:hypothetical protein